MFTPRSASARQTFPSVLGRSSSNTVNSLMTGMAGDLLCFQEIQGGPRLGWNGNEILCPKDVVFKSG
jgi:hypothetical protein